MGKRRRLIAYICGLAVGLVVAGGAVLARDPNPGADLYARLAEAARRGDERAAQYVAKLDTYMAERGLTPSELVVPAVTSRRANEGGLILRVVGAEPWSLTVTNETPLDSRVAIDGYRLLRHAALADLAARGPGRRIVVAVAPAELVRLDRFASALHCDCLVEELIVDVFGPDGWVMSAGRRLGGADLADGAAAAVEREVLDQVAASLDQFPGLRPEEIRLTVRQAKVTGPAKALASVSEHPDLLIVDPLSDIADAYGSLAADVDVRVPDVFGAFASLAITDAFEPAYEPAKSEVRP